MYCICLTLHSSILVEGKGKNEISMLSIKKAIVNMFGLQMQVSATHKSNVFFLFRVPKHKQKVCRLFHSMFK